LLNKARSFESTKFPQYYPIPFVVPFPATFSSCTFPLTLSHLPFPIYPFPFTLSHLLFPIYLFPSTLSHLPFPTCLSHQHLPVYPFPPTLSYLLFSSFPFPPTLVRIPFPGTCPPFHYIFLSFRSCSFVKLFENIALNRNTTR
jgi:hypothetical protein